MLSQASIYIPRISKTYSEKHIKIIMHDNNIGSVSYVDFTPINKKQGFYEDIDNDMVSAFVHFYTPLVNESDVYVWYNKYLNEHFWRDIQNNKPYRLFVEPGKTSEYWICLKNKNPVQRTMMNIHQVVENGRYLENLIMTQADDIKNLREIIDNQNQVITQLIGGLYSQHTQLDMIHLHLDVLNGDKNAKNLAKKINCSIWPTTRQGDENTKRIEKLEETIQMMTSFNYGCFDEEQSDFESLRSDSSSSSERIKNSSDLCGNE